MKRKLAYGALVAMIFGVGLAYAASTNDCYQMCNNKYKGCGAKCADMLEACWARCDALLADCKSVKENEKLV